MPDGTDDILYYATRDIPEYLDTCVALAGSRERHAVLSVVGGLSFLHAIGDRTEALVLVDRSARQISYGRMLLDLIAKVDSLAEFLSILACRRVGDDLRLGWRRFDPRKRLAELLSPAQIELYEATYLRLFHGSRRDSLARRFSRPTQESPRIHWFERFEGRRRRPFNFCWNFGFGNLENERAFQRLRKNLARIEPRFVREDLSRIVLPALVASDLPVHMLMSNCGQTLYSPAEEILRHLIVQPSGKVIYVSWEPYQLRRIELDHKSPHPDAVRKISRFTAGWSVDEMKTYLGYHFSGKELSARSHALHDLREFVASFRNSPQTTRRDCILYHISLENPSPDEIREWYLTAMNRYRRIIHFDWYRFSKPEDVINMLRKIGFHYVFSVSQLDWTGRNEGDPDALGRSYILVWDKRLR